jgi:hypothetical protein
VALRVVAVRTELPHTLTPLRKPGFRLLHPAIRRRKLGVDAPRLGLLGSTGFLLPAETFEVSLHAALLLLVGLDLLPCAVSFG